jgi:peptidoglycan L-alanyl-D-glutamate endopeptidase CwlK
MPKFSQESFSKLSTCHMELQTLFYEVVRHFDCKVLEGHRGEEAQNAAHREGNSKLTWPHSRHNTNPSMAVDVAPYPVDWKNTKRFYWFGGFVMGIAQRLKDEGRMTYSVRFGGDWDRDRDIDDQNFNDLVHFELV